MYLITSFRAFFVKAKLDELLNGNSAIILHKDYNNTNFKIFHWKVF